MLPEGFAWQSILGAGSARDNRALAYKLHQVARLDERQGGGWMAILRYPDGRTITRACSSEAAGRAGIETWATRHQDLLRACAGLQHVEWLANQTWRGKEAGLAQQRLNALLLPVLEQPPGL